MILDFFLDPILRAPTIGCMLMCLSAALMGVIAYLRKQSLLGEALSHASYPGVILGGIVGFELTGPDVENMWISFSSVTGAVVSALIGLYSIRYLEINWKVRSDSALCLILSLFFGVGILLASRIQFTHSSLYKLTLSYLYGQAATMTDRHIFLYGTLSLFIIAILLLLYKEIKALTFDRDFAMALGIRTHLIDAILLFLMSLSIVIGIRSVGVVLMSAMLIAPAAAARQYTNRLSRMLLLASIFGLVSGFLGNYFSVELTSYLHQAYPNERISLPTGPMIVVAASVICLFSLLLAPERGLLVRMARIAYFRMQCIKENLLKTMWRHGKEKFFSVEEIQRYQGGTKLYLRYILSLLARQGWVEIVGSFYRLTADGVQRASWIVRLHRLWEVYLANYLGIGSERVHKSAEEMEHILTPEIEKELTTLLENPKVDPHHQPIPPFEGGNNVS